MGKKILKISLICALILALCIIFGLLYVFVIKDKILYERYRYPNEGFFGKDLYSEITYDSTEYESEIGNRIVDRAYEVARYTGTEQDAETEMGDVGALDQYYYFDSKDAKAQEADFQLITCKITENEGHVWLAISLHRYDENGEYASGGCNNILSLWRIEYRDNEWYVVDTSAAP